MCICNIGYGGADCFIFVVIVLFVVLEDFNVVCDIFNNNCIFVVIRGDRFFNSLTFICYMIEIEVSEKDFCIFLMYSILFD